MKKKSEVKLAWINRLHAGHKLLISLLVAIAVYFIIPVKNLPTFPHIMLSWDIGSITMIILSWITFFSIDSQQIRELCRQQDEKRFVIFLLVLVSTIASLAAVILLLINKSSHLLLLPIGIAGMAFSWLLVHTIFTFRYAHLYYENDKKDASTHAGGLEFPEDDKPDYLDFAYFSFVLGMTFQVSDVEVTSKRLRRLSLLHGMISFVFNTIIVALTINIIAGLTSK